MGGFVGAHLAGDNASSPRWDAELWLSQRVAVPVYESRDMVTSCERGIEAWKWSNMFSCGTWLGAGESVKVQLALQLRGDST